MKNNSQLQNEVKNLKNQVKTLGTSLQLNTTLTSRLALQNTIHKTHNNTRDLGTMFGYIENPTVTDYLKFFETVGIANRVVSAYPEACWVEKPEILDEEDQQEKSVFESEAITLFKTLKLYQYIKRLDILAGIGRYAVLFLGVKDGKNPDQELIGVNLKPQDILFLDVYSEVSVSIESYETDTQSPRYNLPLIYGIQTATGSTKQQTIKVHHTRIIHVADEMLENDVLGTPRLKKVLDDIIDLQKVKGSAPESFFQNARGGLNLNMPENSILANPELLEQEMEDYTNSMSRFLKTKGIDVKEITHNIADPKNTFDVIIACIAGATRIPARLLLGSEAAHLASTQDQANWNNKVKDRQNNFCEPQILRPLIDWFILHGVLPQPKNNEYNVEWPDLGTETDLEKSQIAINKTNALATYVNALGSDQLITPKQFVTEILQEEYRESDLPNPNDFDV